MAKIWGPAICPDDGGELVGHADWGDRLWCPNARHGGNGRFITDAEADHGAPTHKATPRPATMADISRAAALEGERHKVEHAAGQKRKADDRAATLAKRGLVRKPRGTPKECKCGCGGTTKGGTFLPGHDARYHAEQKRKEQEA